MSVIEDFEAPGPRLRIAVPSWRLRRASRVIQPVQISTAASREEFETLMDRGTAPGELIHLRLTKSERRQRSQTRRVRAALYSSDFA